MLSINQLVTDFASALHAVDARRPVHKDYLPGIGAHNEDAAVALILAEMRTRNPTRYATCGQGLRYPGTKQSCDLWVGEPVCNVTEVKMARFWGNNGKPDDTSIKDLLSPYASHRSAVTDCVKLTSSGFGCEKSILIYGFEKPDARMPLEPIIEAFEAVARLNVTLGERHEELVPSLVHPVHARGAVYGWSVSTRVAR
jgi:hypothetical protein